MKIENLKFEWEKHGENCGEDKLRVKVLDCHARIYKAYDNQKWTCNINHQGYRGIESEKQAMKFAEAKIETILVNRYMKAKKELQIFKENNFTFSEGESAPA